jgi:hypothetical protein
MQCTFGADEDPTHMPRMKRVTERKQKSSLVSIHDQDSEGVAIWTAQFGASEKRFSIRPVYQLGALSSLETKSMNNDGVAERSRDNIRRRH